MDQKDFENLKKILPHKPGLLGRERFFNSGVFIPLVWKTGEYHFLFQKRSESIRQKGEICFPGGKIDPKLDIDRYGPSYKKTAIRETIEELGVEKNKIVIAGRLDTLITPMGVVVDAFIGKLIIDDISELNIRKSEVEEAFLLPVSFFYEKNLEEYKVRLEVQPSCIDENGKNILLLPVKELGLPENYEKPWGGRLYRIFAYRTEKGTIWGITAELVHEVMKKMGH